MSDIVQFIRDRLNEDEAIARIADSGDMFFDTTDAIYAEHYQRHDPARVLREVEAKRARLALYVEVTDILFHGKSGGRIKYQRESGRFEALDVEVRRDAALYAEHPDYKQAWAIAT